MKTGIVLDRKIRNLLERAVDFHGHLGPFVTLGVRLALAGLRETSTRGDRSKLHITVALENCLPFSCAVDGIQVVTGCTIGNKRLKIRRGESLAATFQIEGVKSVRVIVKKVAFDDLKRRVLSQRLTSDRLRKVALDIASMSEKCLFTIH